MKLSFAVLDSNSTLNNIKYINQMIVSSGDTADLYLQLVDLDSPIKSNVYSRYIPSNTATLTVNFYNNNTALNMSKIAVMAFPNDDRSIWKVSLSSADTQKLNSVTIKAQLVEGSSIKSIVGHNLIITEPNSPFQC